MNPFFTHLWTNYQKVTPTAVSVKNSLDLDSYEYFNDHVAFRSINLEGHGIDVLSIPFVEQGYKKAGSYFFKEKKLHAIHMENKENPRLPKVFISELILEKCSEQLQHCLITSFKTKTHTVSPERLLTLGRIWPFDYATYTLLSQESEYAAWIYAHGYRVNHFTIKVNSLYDCHIEKVCKMLKASNIKLNKSGGIIKGSKTSGLMQASTIADFITVQCNSTNIRHQIPSCYVEFAERFEVNGALFNGFITKSANHIFESTNKKK
jgi:hypothetical protein